MKLHFIAPVGFHTSQEEVQAVHGGYGNATFGSYKIFEELKKREILSEVTVTDISKGVREIPSNRYEDEHDIGILVTHPLAYVKNKASTFKLKELLSKCKRKYIQVIWECSPLPKELENFWKEDFFDGYLAPSHWGCDLIRKETERPVFYYPHFVDVNNFTLIDIENKKKQDKFVVFFIGQFTERKGVKDAIIAFGRALGHEEDCELIIKTTRMSSVELDINATLRSFAQMNISANKAKIRLITKDLSNEQLGDLYEYSSVLLFPSRGEGFGLPICEAMAQGLPVIYIDWSATKETGEGFNYPIRHIVDDAHSMIQYDYDLNSKYAIPYIESIVEHLKKLYNDWKSDKEKYFLHYQQNRKIVEDKYGLEETVKNYMKIINNEC